MGGGGGRGRVRGQNGEGEDLEKKFCSTQVGREGKAVAVVGIAKGEQKIEKRRKTTKNEEKRNEKSS